MDSTDKPTDKPRLALVGPVLPYRGGIAQYNTQLHRALKKKSRLQTISFKRQYPSWLFHGKSDIEEGMAAHKEAGVKYLIDVYDPLSLRRSANKISSDCELAILNWWTLFWQPGFAYISRRLRKKGIKTVFLCHNLFDHDAKGIKRKVSEKLIKQADAYIVQASEQAELLRSINPKAVIMQQLHPIYRQFPKALKKLPKRGRLELLFFGFIRPYKGLDTLIKAFSLLQDSEVYLTVVGEPWGKAADSLKDQVVALNPANIELHLEYVDDKEAANYFERADVVVLPYISATGSGVVTLAYSYGKPVLATRVGGLSDAVVEGKTGWLVPANSPKKMAAVIKKITRPETKKMPPYIKDFCRRHSWEAMAKSILDLSQKINQV